MLQQKWPRTAYHSLMSNKTTPSILSQYDSSFTGGCRLPITGSALTSPSYMRPEIRYGQSPLGTASTGINEPSSFHLSSPEPTTNTQADTSYSTTTGSSFEGSLPSYLGGVAVPSPVTTMSGFYNTALSNMSSHMTDYSQWGYGNTQVSANYIYGYGSPSISSGYSYPGMSRILD